MTDAQGAITLSSRYTPWGDTLETHGTGNFTYGYFGGVMDAATGLLYVGNGQYYDPATGRFLTRDARPNQTNPYTPWNPIGAVVGPLGLLSMLYSRKKKGGKAGMFLVLLLVMVTVGMTLSACAGNAQGTGITPTVTPMPISATVTQTQGVITTVDSTPTQVITVTPPAPTETPVVLGCPVPALFAQDEEYKRLIEEKFGIILADTRLGSENWPSVHIQIVYGALSRINDMLGGNLNSMLGVHSTLFFHFHNSLEQHYEGFTDRVRRIDFYVQDVFPYHLIYHEMGHLLDNAQGDKYTHSLDHTAVYTGPNQEGERVMGRDCPENLSTTQCDKLTPYNRIDGKGYLKDPLQDPCGKSVYAELHSRSFDATAGNTANEEWGDLFANFVDGNFNVGDPIGYAKYKWVTDRLFGS